MVTGGVSARPSNVVETSRTRSSHNNEVESGDKIRMRNWKEVTANVLKFQPAIEKEAAWFFAGGRRLEFEERIANMNVDVGGIQESRQRSSVTRQVGRYFVVSAAVRKRGYITSTSPTPNTLSLYCLTQGDWWFVCPSGSVNSI